MMSTKFSILLTFVCFLQPHLFVNGRDTDWEVLNFAISDPGKSNPEVLKNAILNIVGDLFTTEATTAAPTTTPCPGATTTTKGCPICTKPTKPPKPTTPAPCKFPQIPDNIRPPWIDFLSHQQAAAIVRSQQPMAQQPQPNPLVSAAHDFLHYKNIPHRHGDSPVNHYHSRPPTKPECNCGPNKLAEFDVNIPCPKPTPKPKPIREIIVKVPCPTTKKPECPCNPCPCKNKPTKPKPKPSRTTTRRRTTSKRPKPTKPPKESCSEEESKSESSESAEIIHKSYEQYHPRGKYEKVINEDQSCDDA
jgi:hypothetical protein